ncbi:hypothetical protein [Streptomyces sp. NPDC096142]|uniref:hypothetical protein n=1 Tax=Streptomyces sp. NPDC096142 TaxID=3366077 RepID=UPI0038203C8B
MGSVAPAASAKASPLRAIDLLKASRKCVSTAVARAQAADRTWAAVGTDREAGQ